MQNIRTEQRRTEQKKIKYVEKIVFFSLWAIQMQPKK